MPVPKLTTDEVVTVEVTINGLVYKGTASDADVDNGWYRADAITVNKDERSYHRESNRRLYGHRSRDCTV